MSVGICIIIAAVILAVGYIVGKGKFGGVILISIIATLIIAVGYLIVKLGGATIGGIRYLFTVIESGQPSALAFGVGVVLFIISIRCLIKIANRYNR